MDFFIKTKIDEIVPSGYFYNNYPEGTISYISALIEKKQQRKKTKTSITCVPVAQPTAVNSHVME